jgi:hypothetical protein
VGLKGVAIVEQRSRIRRVVGVVMQELLQHFLVS